MSYTNKPYQVSTEIAYKNTLANQIDRIAILFSTKIDTNVQNSNQAYRMLVAAQRKAVDILEDMLAPYFDMKYIKAMKLLKSRYKKSLKNPDDKVRIETQEEYTAKKFRKIMRLMDRENLLLQLTRTEVHERWEPVEDVRRSKK